MEADEPSRLSFIRFWLLHACALLIAAGVAAALSDPFLAAPILFVPAFWFALGHAVVLGIPLYILVRLRGFQRWWVAPACGFAIGALPVAMLTLGSGADLSSVDGVATVVNGVRTGAGWIQYLYAVASAGVLGAAGGLVFGLVVRPTLPAPVEGGARIVSARGWRLYDLIPTLLTIAILGLVFWLPTRMEDRSCHNPLRDGRTSIASRIEGEFDIGRDDWPALARLAADFARARGWSYWGDVRRTGDFNWLSISICDAEGTEIVAEEAGSMHGVQISVFQPQDGDSWQPAFRDFYRSLNARWPDRLRFQDEKGDYRPTPAWLIQPGSGTASRPPAAHH